MGYSQHEFRQPAVADPEPRGGSHVWVSEIDAKKWIVDNDWIEVFNINGTLTARAVVS